MSPGDATPGDAGGSDGGDGQDAAASDRGPRCGDGVPHGEACFFPVRLPFARGPTVAVDLDGDGVSELVTRDPEGLALYRMSDDGFVLDRRFSASGTMAFGGDFDGDGDLDLFLEDSVRYRLYVQTEHAFELKSDLPFQGELSYALGADLDRDGRQDLVLRVDDSLQVWRQNEQDEYELTSVTESYWTAFAVADVDHDGILDLIVGNSQATLWCRGLGDARFEETATFLFNSGAVADLDGDGALDVAGVVDGHVVVLFDFTDEVTYPLAGNTVGLMDLDADGADELIVGQQQGEVFVLRPSRERIELLGSAGPSFYPFQYSAADLDGDGRRDLIFRNSWDLTVRLQRDGFTFADGGSLVLSPTDSRAQVVQLDPDPQQEVLFGGTLLKSAGSDHHIQFGSSMRTSPDSFLVDLDRDDRLDLVSAEAIHRGLGDGTFEAEPHLLDPPRTGLIVADVNHDWWPDLVHTSSAALWVSLNLQGFEFSEPESHPRVPMAVPAADLDGNGGFDIVAGGKVWFGQRARKFVQDEWAVSTLRASDSAVIDLDGDDAAELLAVVSGFVGVFEQITGGFTQTATLAVLNPVSLAVIDDRLIVLSADGSYSSFRIQSDGIHFEHFTQPLRSAHGVALLPADVSGDGRVDLVIASWCDFGGEASGLMQAWLGTSTNTFALGRTFGNAGVPQSLEIADVDGDGLLDVGVGSTVQQSSTGVFQVHLNAP